MDDGFGLEFDLEVTDLLRLIGMGFVALCLLLPFIIYKIMLFIYQHRPGN